jgi:hypothetical protein
MVWKQYSDEAHMLPTENTNEDQVDIDDYEDRHPEPMEFEFWSDWYSRDLMNLWMSLRTYTRDAGVSSYLLTNATYSDFVEFVYRFSHGFPNSCPS